jgi:hypothetical protein
MKYFVVDPCTTSAGFEIKLKKSINLKKAEKAFSKIGQVIASSSVVLLVKIKDYSISVYASGRMMVKSEKKMDSKSVEKLAEKIVKELDKEDAI